MGTLELFRKAITNLENTIKQVKEDQRHAPTPCAEWDTHDLLNHVVNELSWIPDLVAGKTIAEVGTKYDGDLLGSDPSAAWRTVSAAAIKAFSEPDAMERTVHLSFGDFSGQDYCEQIISDLAVHGWDLAKAIGADTTIDPELLDVIERVFLPMAPEGREAGVFGPEIAVDDEADRQARVLATLGRSSQ